MANTRHRGRVIGILGFEGANALDIAGPSEVFTSASGAQARYRLVVIGLAARRFSTESGLTLESSCSLEAAPEVDTLIVPGGHGLREPGPLARAATWVRDRAAKTRRIASVCTGIYALAEAGLLDGLRVTTHWRHAAAVAARYPRLSMEADSIFIQQGRIYTSAGITAGIDLALALVEEDLGAEAALAVARELVVFLRRPGGQEQFSEPLRLQTRTHDRFGEIVAHVAAHLASDLSVEALARRAALSPRQFGRRFAQRFGCTPGEFVEEQRLTEARRLLGTHTGGLDEVASAVGYGTAHGLRRAFERRFGVAPGAYRARFALDPGARAAPTPSRWEDLQ